MTQNEELHYGGFTGSGAHTPGYGLLHIQFESSEHSSLIIHIHAFPLPQPIRTSSPLGSATTPTRMTATPPPTSLNWDNPIASPLRSWRHTMTKKGGQRPRRREGRRIKSGSVGALCYQILFGLALAWLPWLPTIWFSFHFL